MPRTKLLEILFVATSALGLLFVGWAVIAGSTSAPATAPTATTAAMPTLPPTPTITPTPRPRAISLTILHTNDTWGYVWPCG
ncbi:MAG: hypothetical protein NUW24_13330 [Anaerolineae bacterium]|jgi:2',3'-cyclic-nucleotide 2'-phosphodiesterase (5'-nucleotidase family)|nr:hypothetical protein [Anaerolineae bacterium]MDH7473836.1 hypothetical protein [Anaerolineae bacterium]